MANVPFREYTVGFQVDTSLLVREMVRGSLGNWTFDEGPRAYSSDTLGAFHCSRCETTIPWLIRDALRYLRCRCDERARREAADRYWGALLDLPDEAWGEPVYAEDD